MSKRAEELARAVAKSVSDAIHTPIVLDIYGSAVDMIDAELRKERERCAERVIAKLDSWDPISQGGREIKEAMIAGIPPIIVFGEE